MTTIKIAPWLSPTEPEHRAPHLPHLTQAFINRLRRPPGVRLVAYTDIDEVYLWEEHPDGTEREIPWPKGWSETVSEYWLKAHGYDIE